jgi:histidine triad (HIT) family protein
MNPSCEFCKIAAYNKPCHIIYEDNLVMAFLDSSPVNPGHVLVIPKQHFSNFYELDHNSYSSLMAAVRTIAKGINSALRPPKVGVLIAGFDVDHTHVHVIPMMTRSDVATKRVIENAWPVASEADLQMTANSLISAMATDA